MHSQDSDITYLILKSLSGGQVTEGQPPEGAVAGAQSCGSQRCQALRSLGRNEIKTWCQKWDRPRHKQFGLHLGICRFCWRRSPRTCCACHLPSRPSTSSPASGRAPLPHTELLGIKQQPHSLGLEPRRTANGEAEVKAPLDRAKALS